MTLDEFYDEVSDAMESMYKWDRDKDRPCADWMADLILAMGYGATSAEAFRDTVV